MDYIIPKMEQVDGGCERCGGSFYMQAIIIVLLLFVIYRIAFRESLTSNALDGYGTSSDPGYLGQPLADTVYTSGATLRRLGTLFSSTDQGSESLVGSDKPVGHRVLVTADQSAAKLDMVMFPTSRVPKDMIRNYF